MKRNFLLGKGERLVETVVVVRGGSPKIPLTPLRKRAIVLHPC
jgi:hypothetical protein